MRELNHKLLKRRQKNDKNANLNKNMSIAGIKNRYLQYSIYKSLKLNQIEIFNSHDNNFYCYSSNNSNTDKTIKISVFQDDKTTPAPDRNNELNFNSA